jgi:hypothetical protein
MLYKIEKCGAGKGKTALKQPRSGQQGEKKPGKLALARRRKGLR